MNSRKSKSLPRRCGCAPHSCREAYRGSWLYLRCASNHFLLIFLVAWNIRLCVAPHPLCPFCERAERIWRWRSLSCNDTKNHYHTYRFPVFIRYFRKELHFWRSSLSPITSHEFPHIMRSFSRHTAREFDLCRLPYALHRRTQSIQWIKKGSLTNFI